MKFRIMEKRGKFRIRKRKPLHWVWESERYANIMGCSYYYPYDFDTYKQAENYIKKHYGLEGVKAIEEPEWRVV